MFNTHGAVSLFFEQLSLKRMNVYYFLVEVNTLLKVNTLFNMIFFSLSHDNQQCSHNRMHYPVGFQSEADQRSKQSLLDT